jgi:DNA-binding MarR family transcriptional regulator
MKKERELTDLANEIDAHLRAIRRELRQPLTSVIARGELTAPQRNVVQILVGADALSLKELSRRAELAHSTVSGIVDRLEKRGLVARQPDPKDGRFSRIAVTGPVRNFVEKDLPKLTAGPLLKALRRSSPGQRAKIIDGLRTLHRALGDDVTSR